MFTPARLILILLTAFCLAIPPKSSSAVPEPLIVHEWGTFTSVYTADGKAQYWDPLTGPSELPRFVYRPAQDDCPKCGLWLARMETPVIYFYPGREGGRMQVSADVSFPQGRITEWYPQAQSVKNGIHWTGVDLYSGQATFPVEQTSSHYYAARETDAAPIRATHAKAPEWEKFLFYRGTGNFQLPLTAGLCSDTIQLSNNVPEEVARVILFENRGGSIGWSIHGPVTGSLAITRPAPGQSISSLKAELVKVLMSQGLYDKEAAAMVKTWQDSWFEEGVRVFYIVPRKVTDSILPLTITPQPTELARVFVGRAELITPEMEQDLEAAVRDFQGSSSDARRAAVATVRRYGRFATPVLLHLRETASSNEARSRILELQIAARQPQI